MRSLLLLMSTLLLGIETGCATTDSAGVSTAAQPALTSPTTVAPTSGFGDPTTTITVDAGGAVNWVGGAWYVPLPVSAGDAIGTVTAVVRDNGSGNGHPTDGNNVLVDLVSRTSGGDVVRASWSSNGSGTQQTGTLTPSGGSYTVQVGDEMLVRSRGLMGGALPGPSTVPSMTGVITVAPPVIQPLLHTLKLSTLTPGNPIYGQAIASGVTFATQIALPVGATIAAVRLGISDATPASYSLQLREAPPPNFLRLVSASPPNGGPSPQYLATASSLVVMSGHTYEVNLSPASGGNLVVWDGEIDYY